MQWSSGLLGLSFSSPRGALFGEAVGVYWGPAFLSSGGLSVMEVVVMLRDVHDRDYVVARISV